ncbi:MAG: hypothetical protein JJD98_06090 [Polaromonas sp.]|nr:hypothetical protein [Polaromonas sp.]
MTARLYLMVEAGDLEEAQRRLKRLAFYVGIASGKDIEIIKMRDCPGGVPSFFDSFFKGEEVDAEDISVAPSTTTLH